MRPRFLIIFVVAVISTAGCAYTIGGSLGGGSTPAIKITQTTQVPSCGGSPGCLVRDDGGYLDPPIDSSGSPSVCTNTRLDGSHIESYCRVIEGDGDAPWNDHRNWQIDYNTNGGPATVVGSCCTGYYGLAIVNAVDGSMFEGCQLVGPYVRYVCDFKVSKPVVRILSTSTTAWYLDALWQTGTLTTSALVCAAGVVGLWNGAPMTYPFLAGCAAATAPPS